MFNLIQLVYSGNFSWGQVYLSPARFVPSSQIVPSYQVTGNFIVVKPAQRWLAMFRRTNRQDRVTDPMCAVQLVEASHAGWWRRNRLFSMSCSRKQNVLLNRQLAVEERLEGWWGRANSSLGTGTIAIVLLQDGELENAETCWAHSRKHWRTLPSFSNSKFGGNGEFQAGGWRRSIPVQDKAATKPQSSSAAQSTVTGSALFGPEGAGR